MSMIFQRPVSRRHPLLPLTIGAVGLGAASKSARIRAGLRVAGVAELLLSFSPLAVIIWCRPPKGHGPVDSVLMQLCCLALTHSLEAEAAPISPSCEYLPPGAYHAHAHVWTYILHVARAPIHMSMIFGSL